MRPCRHMNLWEPIWCIGEHRTWDILDPRNIGSEEHWTPGEHIRRTGPPNIAGHTCFDGSLLCISSNWESIFYHPGRNICQWSDLKKDFQTQPETKRLAKTDIFCSVGLAVFINSGWSTLVPLYSPDVKDDLAESRRVNQSDAASCVTGRSHGYLAATATGVNVSCQTMMDEAG